MVGVTLRRLVDKVLCATHQEEASTLLWLLQIGISKPLVTEVGLQTARQWLKRKATDSNAVFVKVDFANAFNSVDRQAFLEQCRHHLAGLSKWAECGVIASRATYSSNDRDYLPKTVCNKAIHWDLCFLFWRCNLYCRSWPHKDPSGSLDKQTVAAWNLFSPTSTIAAWHVITEQWLQRCLHSKTLVPESVCRSV